MRFGIFIQTTPPDVKGVNEVLQPTSELVSTTTPEVNEDIKNMKWCEIFRTGKHTDSNGNTKDWTDTDLQTICNNFESKNPDVPICVGHPKTNSPAYGWIESLKIAGDKLYASFKDVQPEFEEAVNKGLFRTRSISLTKDLVPRHLAFLGAQAPAIKGMEQFCFEEANIVTPFSVSNQEADSENDIIIDFSEENNETPDHNADEGGSRSEEGVPPFVKGGKKGLETPSPTTPPYVKEANVNDNTESPQGEPVAEGGAPSASLEGVNEVWSLNSKTTPPNVKGGKMTEELEKQIAAKDEELAAVKKELEEARQNALRKDFEEFCDSAIAEGNILPAQRENVLNLLFANTESNINFDDGSSKSSNEVFKDFVKSLRQIDYQKIAKESNLDGSSNTDFSDFKAEDWETVISEEISKAAQSGRSISPKEALQKIKKGI